MPASRDTDRVDPDSALDVDDLLSRAGDRERTKYEDVRFVHQIRRSIELPDAPLDTPYTLGNSRLRWPPLAATLIACFVAWPLIDLQAMQALSHSLLGGGLFSEGLLGEWSIAQLSLPPSLQLLPLLALGLGVWWSVADE